MAHLHCLQHVPFEGLGHIEKWIATNKHSVSYTRFYLEDTLPVAKDFDCLVIMGGPMGVYDEALYPWLKAEKEFIRESIKCHKKVLGICLGAQLIAAVCGARVYPNAKKEIGWFPVNIAGSFQKITGIERDKLTVFHWHGDTFDLPIGAINHVTSEACPHQLFTIDDTVIGIQFHFETTRKTIQGMVENCGDELTVSDRYIQSKEEILHNINYIQESNKVLDNLLTNFIE